MNTIFIHDLRVETRIGVYEWEKHLAQTLRIDLELGLPQTDAFRSDDFADAVDYAEVVAALRRFALDHGHRLLERFAQGIADLVLGDARVEWVRVRVAKLGALPDVREIGVSIERRRA